MRVVFGHQRFGVQPFGGISRYFVELALGLSRIPGVHPSIFSPFHVNHYLRASPSVHSRGVHLPPFPGSGLPLGIANQVLSELFVRPRRDIDIYHETYYSAFDTKPRGAARVLTVFDMIHELYPHEFGKMDRTSRSKASAVERADHVICISENTRQDLIRILDVPAEKTSVVYLASSLEQGDRLATPEVGRPYILYVGGRAGYKNFSTFLRAYASSTTLRRDFRIQCFGGGRFSDSELGLFDELGLSLGDVQQISGPDRALANIYIGAVMLVYPSIYEGFGLPPLEAMSLGCPVVCSNSSSIPEIVGDAGQYFSATDPDSIRHEVELIANSPTRVAELAHAGRLRAREFSWDKCAAGTLDVYRTLGGSWDAPALH